MRRVVSLFLPDWPADLLRRRSLPTGGPPDRPPAGDALTRLARWCRRYTPLTAPAPADGVWLDVTGCAPLFGGEAGLLSDLLARLSRHGLTARAALADTPGAAHALARFAPGSATIVPPGATAAALAALPLAALRLDPAIVSGLARLGLLRIGQICGIARAPLTRRFGASLWWRLDQALGREEEPLSPLRPAEALEASLAFPEPIATAESLAAAFARLAEDLCRRLERAGAGLRRCELLCRRSDGESRMIRIGTARPSRDPAHLARLLGERIGEIDPGEGIDSLTLVASLDEPLAPVQATGLDQAAAPPPCDLAALVDRLANRLGEGRVYRAAPRQSAWPERAVRRLPPLAPPAACDWPAALPRPSRLLLPPEPVETLALLPDHPPLFFVWRRRRHAVRRADGPERICGEWWRGAAEEAALRDYFQLEDETGARFWLFRAAPGAGHWFLHGFFG